ncbi:MAG: hypothetical protein CMP23_17070 [Rickettsiales bacterium]|nr:hypothetical protein [Rickettsiales bacterium]
MNRPLLSICIPTYQRVALLKELLESLLPVNELTFAVELVVSDNASTDGTAELLERYQARLPLRVLRQRSNVGIAANTIAAFRGARGTYTLYLADDDRLDLAALERCMGHLVDKPEVVCLQVPWVLWDAASDSEMHPFYRLDETVLFAPEQGLDCINFVLGSSVFPEVAIYRTEVLARILLYPRGVYVGFVMLLRALRYGSVCFSPDSYYRSLVRSQGGLAGGTEGQEGHRQAVSYFDRYRGALEVALLSALQNLAPLPLPSDLRAQADRMINDFVVMRMRLAVGLCISARRFGAAHELQQRSLLWRGDVTAAEVQEWERQLIGLIGVEAAVEVLDSLPDKRGLVLCGFTDPDGVLPAFEALEANCEVEVRDEATALRAADRREYVYLVERAESRQRLLESGLPPGHVMEFQALIAPFRILPRSFSQ